MIQLYDDETGLCVGELHEGDRILRCKTIEHLKETTVIPKTETFVKVYRNATSALVDERLTGGEMMIFVHLMLNLRYKSNVAAYENGRFINRLNLEHDLQINEKTIRRCLMVLKKKGMVVECDTSQGKCFIVNPFLCNVGDRVNNTSIDIFKKSKWYREWNSNNV